MIINQEHIEAHHQNRIEAMQEVEKTFSKDSLEVYNLLKELSAACKKSHIPLLATVLIPEERGAMVTLLPLSKKIEQWDESGKLNPDWCQHVGDNYLLLIQPALLSMTCMGYKIYMEKDGERTLLAPTREIQ